MVSSFLLSKVKKLKQQRYRPKENRDNHYKLEVHKIEPAKVNRKEYGKSTGKGCGILLIYPLDPADTLSCDKLNYSTSKL